MDQLYTYQILQELQKESFEDKWGLIISVIIQAIVLYITIHYSIKLSKREFEQQIKVKDNEEKVIQNKIVEILNQAVTKELKQIDENIELISNHLSTSPREVSNLQRIFFTPIYLESILRIDYYTLVRVLEEKIYGTGNVVDFISSIKEITFYMNKINEHQDDFQEKFSSLMTVIHSECIELMRLCRQKFDKEREGSELLIKSYDKFVKNQYQRDLDLIKSLDTDEKPEILNNIDLIQNFSKEVLDSLLPINDFGNPIYLAVIRVSNVVNQIEFILRAYKNNIAATMQKIDFNKRVLIKIQSHLEN